MVSNKWCSCPLVRVWPYRQAITGLNIGGGKAVIIGDAKTQKHQSWCASLVNLYIRYGRYITAEDVGWKPQTWIL
jgi:leucine dehydrogenase